MGRYHVGEDDGEGDYDSGGQDMTGGASADQQQKAGQHSGSTDEELNDMMSCDDTGNVEEEEPWQDRCHDPVATPPQSSVEQEDAFNMAAAAIVPYDGNDDGDAYDEYGHEHERRRASRRRRQTWSGPFRSRQYQHNNDDTNHDHDYDQDHDPTIYEEEVEDDDEDQDLYAAMQNNERIGSRIRMLWSTAGDRANGSDRRVHGHVLTSPSSQQQQLYEAQLYGPCHPSTGINEYGEEQPSNPSGKSSRLKRYLLNVILVILAGTALAYTKTRAPPPPPPHDDWTTYILYSTQRIVTEVERLSMDMGYVVGGFVNNVYMDAVDLKNTVLTLTLTGHGINGGRPKCFLTVPSSLHDEYGHSTTAASSVTERLLTEGIVGQDRAIKTIARALDAWEIRNPGGQEEECAADADAPPDAISAPNTGSGKPLVLLLTGPEGAGKTETARLLARLLFGHCAVSSPVGIPSNRILQINGQSYAGKSDHQTHHMDARAFRDKLIGHVSRQQGAGAVIILRQTEAMPPTLLKELVGIVKSSDTVDTKGEGTVRWDNVLFILVSDLGVDKVFKSISAYEGIQYLPEKDLSLAIRNELDGHFGTSTGLGNVVNSIAVFMPLGMSEVEHILLSKIRQLSKQHEGTLWKRLDVTDRTLHHFVGPDHVDYLSMKKRDSESIILTFSKRGAHTLEDGTFMQTLRSIRRRMSPRPELVAVFDYNPGTEEAVMKWCNEGDETNADQVRERSLSGCEEFWRDTIDK